MIRESEIMDLALASSTSRNSVVRGRPIFLRAGRNDSTSARSRSVRSLAYLRPCRAYLQRVVSFQGICVSVRCRNRTESQTHETTQLFSGWAPRRMGFDIMPLGKASQMSGGKDAPGPHVLSGAATSSAVTEADRTSTAAGLLGTTAQSSAGTLTLVFGGDTSLGDAYLKKAKASEHIQRLEVDPCSFFEALAPLISDKSHLIVNLETVLSTEPQGPLDGIKSYLGWDQPERTIATLKQIGTNAVSLANNHTMDYGPDKLVETISHLKRAEIDVFGAGKNIREASYPLKLSSPLGNIYVLAGFEVRAKYRDIFNFYAAEDSPGVNPFRQKMSNRISEAISRCTHQPIEPVVRDLFFPTMQV